MEQHEYPWPAGRADLHWHLLFDPQVLDEALVRPYRELTHRPGLAPVAARWMHTTVMHGGPVAAYTSTEIDTIVDRVRAACESIAPFDLVFDRPTIGTVGIEFPARPGAPARHLWELTTRVDAEVTAARFPLLPSAYYPHLTGAYGVAGPQRADRREMKVLLSDHPGEPVTLRAQKLSLVAQWHDRRHITWEHLADVPLSA
ncbi:2'-5' RNA ligase family protein [Streptomyces aurantiacus]|uniref:2'-5' RNA ligase family protein n=1 Tax=Streptomyces aurantiacus TaxID=47760 RepID=UPI0036D3D342